MPTRLQRFRCLAFALLCSLFAGSITHAIPAPKPAVQEMLAQVDADRWVDQVQKLVENEDLDRPGHFYRSRYALRVREAVQYDGRSQPDEACDNAADYIAREFESHGLKVEFDTFSHRRISLSGTQGDYVMRNVVATLPGNGPNADRTYLVTGHYDSIASKTEGWEENWRDLPAPGATDNASGIAEMLEIARIISPYRFDFTIQFIAFSGEELGLFGSRHYAESVASGSQRIAGVINLDQLGHDPGGTLDIHVVANPASEWLMRAFETIQQSYGIGVEIVPVIADEFVYSDHAPFWEIGTSAVMVAEESSFEGPEWPEHTHGPDDTTDKLSRPLGERAIQLALATLAELAHPYESDQQVLPDLSLVSLDAPVQATHGAQVRAEAVVQNNSDQSIVAPLWFILTRPNGERQILLEREISLAARDAESTEVDFLVDTWGIHRLQATVNPTVTLFESRFENNSITQELSVAGELQLAGLVAYPNPLRRVSEAPQLSLHYELSTDAQVTVSIYNLLGQVVHESEVSVAEEGGHLGPNTVAAWDGRNRMGGLVAPGVYICSVRAVSEDGSEQHRSVKLAVE